MPLFIVPDTIVRALRASAQSSRPDTATRAGRRRSRRAAVRRTFVFFVGLLAAVS